MHRNYAAEPERKPRRCVRSSAEGLGPYSKPARFTSIDGRTREARLMKRVRAALVAHVGGSPTAAQDFLIRRAATLALQIDLMEREAAARGGPMSIGTGRDYLAWSNALERCLRSLGIEGAHVAGGGTAGLQQYLASREARV